MSIEAVCILNNPKLGITGVIVLKEDFVTKETVIKVKVSGLPPNSKHGFHVHTSGDLRNGCTSLCSHWNPHGTSHGGPNDPKSKRHLGDLGNLQANGKGNVNTTIRDKLVKLRGKYSVIGRSLILHEGEDDLGLGGNEESLKTGNAGARIACGVIGYSET